MSTRSDLRVVVTGHSGLSKQRVLEKLCRTIYSSDADWAGAGTDAIRGELEKRIAQIYPADPPGPLMGMFLRGDREYQHALWRAHLDRSISKFEEDRGRFNTRIGLLSLHLSFNYYGNFFSPLSWIDAPTDPTAPLERPLIDHLLQRFEPDICINLIDDIQVVQQRIRRRGVQLRLRELIAWRNIETVLTDALSAQVIRHERWHFNVANFPFERSPIVAIRHSPEMLYRLICEPERLRVYASFPITRTRDDADNRAEVDRFRELLSAEFTVFDPLTIDEKPIAEITSSTRSRNAGQRVVQRWPIDPETSLVGDDPQQVQVDPAEASEILIRPSEGLKHILDREVETRDDRLINQSDCVVVYRPTWKTRQRRRASFSGGTSHEVRYAGQILRPVYVIHDVGDGSLTPDVFDAEVERTFAAENLTDPHVQRRVMSEVIEALKSDAPALVEHRMHGTERLSC